MSGLLNSIPHRTRIKFCGLTRVQDVQAAVAAGADAVGFVFYPKSPRFVTATQAAALIRHVPPFVSTVGLFVNADDAWLDEVLRQAPLSMLQFHGDESPARCAEVAQRYGRSWLRAARVTTDTDLVEFGQSYATAAGLLLDAFVEGYGGGGHVFDWTLIPSQWLTASSPSPASAPPLVLSGGLTAHNVTEAITRVRPFAVDVSSGIEQAKGIKDAARMQAFVAAVRQADASMS